MGDETDVVFCLQDAHAEAGFQVGRPFAADGVYDFGAERDMTRRVAGLEPRSRGWAGISRL